MNTVFKFHYHAWLLLGLASALILLVLTHLPVPPSPRPPVSRSPLALSPSRAPLLARLVAVVLASAVVLAGGVYPVTATYVKSGAFAGTPTLDGSRFLRTWSAGEYDAIAWLRAQAAERPVVAEAVGPDYQEFGRVSAFSGLPTIVGWIGHQLQWRGASVDLLARERDVDLLYTSDDAAVVASVLARYGVQFVYVGVLERAKYGDQVHQRFVDLLEVAHESNGTVVYRVPPRITLGYDALAGASISPAAPRAVGVFATE